MKTGPSRKPRTWSSAASSSRETSFAPTSASLRRKGVQGPPCQGFGGVPPTPTSFPQQGERRTSYSNRQRPVLPVSAHRCFIPNRAFLSGFRGFGGRSEGPEGGFHADQFVEHCGHRAFHRLGGLELLVFVE